MLKAIKYSAQTQSLKDEFDALPKNKKSGKYWDSEEPRVVAARSEIKGYYLKEQNFTCAYCQQQIVVTHQGAWDAEHIIPKGTHPQFTFNEANLCISCKDCNNEKRDQNVLKKPNRVRFPDKDEDYTIAHPHFDEYSYHIRRLPNSLFFLPKTKKGIKTIEICGLLRFVLAFGEYEVTDTQIKKEIALRHDLLQETKDPAEYMLLIAELEDLMGKLKAVAREAGMKKLLEKRRAETLTADNVNAK